MLQEDKLYRMQEQAKLRHDFSGIFRTNVNSIKGVVFFDGEHIPSVRALFTKSGYLKKYRQAKVDILLDQKKEEKAVQPQKTRGKNRSYDAVARTLTKAHKKIPPAQNKISRPPSVYDNHTSPYGIYAELQKENLKKHG